MVINLNIAIRNNISLIIWKINFYLTFTYYMARVSCGSFSLYCQMSLKEMSSFRCRVTVSGELMFLESYGNCDITNTVTLPL